MSNNDHSNGAQQPRERSGQPSFTRRTTLAGLGTGFLPGGSNSGRDAGPRKIADRAPQNAFLPASEGDAIIYEKDGTIHSEGRRGTITRSDEAHEVFQTTIDTLGENADILVLEGTYTINETIDLTQHGMTLRGVGNDTILKMGDGLNSQLMRNNTLHLDGIWDVTISDLQVDGNRLNQDASNQEASGIVFINGNHCAVRRVYVHDTSKHCVVFTGPENHNNKVLDCRFEYATAEHSDGRTSAHVWQTGGSNLLVANCFFEYATDNAVGWAAFESTNTAILDNVFVDCFVAAPGPGADGCVIAGNHVYGTPPISNAVFIKFISRRRGRRNFVIANNVVHGVDPDAEHVQNPKRACVLSRPNAPIENLVLQGNVWNAENVAQAIELKSGENVQISNETVLNSNRNGIIFRGVKDAKVTDCLIKNTNADDNDFQGGVVATSRGDVPSENVTIQNNTIVDDRDSPRMYNGVWVPRPEVAERVTISDNSISGARNADRDVDLGVPGLRVNNLAYNEGAPDATGYWNDRGYEGLKVRDLENQETYLYNAGTWTKISGGGSSDDGGEDTPEAHYGVGNATITPDGDLETEGLSTWSVADDGTVIELADGETAGTLGGDVWLAWDADNIYFQAAIEDQAHVQPYEPGELFKADNVQVAVAPGAEGWEEFQQYTLALNDDGTQVYGQVKTGSETLDAGVRDFDAEIVRDDAAEVTRYEVAIPWAELDAIGGFDPAEDEYFGVDWAVMDDDDGSGLDNYARWDVTGDSAITGGKQPGALKTARLLD